MSSMNTEMRTHTSDLTVWYLCQLVIPVQLAVQPTAADKDVPPTTRPESGELQFMPPLKYMPMRALPWPFTPPYAFWFWMLKPCRLQFCW